MSGDVIILGANGRFGRHAVEAFAEAGWTVRAQTRGAPPKDLPARVAHISCDALDRDALMAACGGAGMIVNALNPPYPQWSRVLARLTQNVLAAARPQGATVMVPGNVYNYGAQMPEIVSEKTPQVPTTRKGRLRVEMEEAYARAADDGVKTLVLRAGDFLERRVTGNWFDSHMVTALPKGAFLYPGPLDRVHAWAYLPDMARAMAGLAANREGRADFETIGFPGYALTGAQLVSAVERVMGGTLKVTGLPWPAIRAMGLVRPMMREVAEMAYLWRVPHRIDGSAFAAALPGFEATPLEQALEDSLADYRDVKQS